MTDGHSPERPRWEVGIDHLTLLDLSPPDLVSVAAEAGFDAVGLRVSPASPDEEPWPMGIDSPMLAETRRRLADTGVRVLDVEVLQLRPTTTPEDHEYVLQIGARLGARYLTVNGDDPDLERARHNFAALAAAARDYGVRPLIEALPYTRVSKLAEAVRVAEGSHGGGILIDPLHLQRAGDGVDAVRALSPQLPGYMQVCDGPLAAPVGLPTPDDLARAQSSDGGDLQIESRTMRLLPGDGELPLHELIGALGRVPLSVEAPNSALRADLGTSEFARRARRAVDDLVRAARAPAGEG